MLANTQDEMPPYSAAAQPTSDKAENQLVDAVHTSMTTELNEACLAPNIICQLSVFGKLFLKVSICWVLHLELVHHACFFCLPQGLMALPAVNIPASTQTQDNEPRGTFGVLQLTSWHRYLLSVQ